MADTTPSLAAKRAAGGLPLWSKILIYGAVMLALGFAAQAWLS